MQKNVSRLRFEIEFNVFNIFKKTSIANLAPASLFKNVTKEDLKQNLFNK